MHKCSREGFNTIPTIESPLPILGLQLCPNPGPAIHLESQACGTLGSQSGSLYFVLQKRVHAVRPHSVASLAHTPPWFHLAHANCFLIPFPPVTVPVNDSVSAVILKAVKEDDSPVGTRSHDEQVSLADTQAVFSGTLSPRPHCLVPSPK